MVSFCSFLRLVEAPVRDFPARCSRHYRHYRESSNYRLQTCLVLALTAVVCCAAWMGQRRKLLDIPNIQQPHELKLKELFVSLDNLEAVPTAEDEAKLWEVIFPEDFLTEDYAELNDTLLLHDLGQTNDNAGVLDSGGVHKEMDSSSNAPRDLWSLLQAETQGEVYQLSRSDHSNSLFNLKLVMDIQMAMMPGKNTETKGNKKLFRLLWYPEGISERRAEFPDFLVAPHLLCDFVLLRAGPMPGTISNRHEREGASIVDRDIGDWLVEYARRRFEADSEIVCVIEFQPDAPRPPGSNVFYPPSLIGDPAMFKYSAALHLSQLIQAGRIVSPPWRSGDPPWVLLVDRTVVVTNWRISPLDLLRRADDALTVESVEQRFCLSTEKLRGDKKPEPPEVAEGDEESANASYCGFHRANETSEYAPPPKPPRIPPPAFMMVSLDMRCGEEGPARLSTTAIFFSPSYQSDAVFVATLLLAKEYRTVHKPPSRSSSVRGSPRRTSILRDSSFFYVAAGELSDLSGHRVSSLCSPFDSRFWVSPGRSPQLLPSPFETLANPNNIQRLAAVVTFNADHHFVPGHTEDERQLLKRRHALGAHLWMASPRWLGAPACPEDRHHTERGASWAWRPGDFLASFGGPGECGWRGFLDREWRSSVAEHGQSRERAPLPGDPSAEDWKAWTRQAEVEQADADSLVSEAQDD